MPSVISQYQLTILVTGFLLHSSLVLAIGGGAQQDRWMAVLLAQALGLGTALIYTNISIRYPNNSIVEYSPSILGKALGKVIGLLYILFAIHLGALVINNFAGFMNAVLMPDTPVIVFLLVIGISAGYVIYCGLEVLARFAQVIAPFSAIILFATFLLLIRRINVENYFPLFESGFKPFLWTSLGIYILPFGEAILFTMILPSVLPVSERTKGLIRGFLLTGLIMLIITLVNIGLLGPLLPFLTYPTFSSIRLLERNGTAVDAVYSGIFMLASYTKVSVCLYAASTGLSQWLNLRDHRPLIWPLVIIIVSLGNVVYKNDLEAENFINSIWPLYALPYVLIFPLGMLIISVLIKNKPSN